MSIKQTTYGLLSFFLETYRKKIEGRDNLKKIIDNSGWLFIDKFIRMGIGLVIGIFVARYLGPEKFGVFNYAVAFVTLFSAIASFGIDDLIIRNLITSPEKEDVIMGSALLLKLIGSFISIVIAVIFITHTTSFTNEIYSLIIILAIGYIFQSFFIIEGYFKSKQLVKMSVYAFIVSFIIASIVRIYLIHVESNVVAFAMVSLGEAIMSAILLVVVYCKHQNKLLGWKVDYEVITDIAKKGLPMVFALIANSIYMRIDQVMIGELLGQKEVGLYSTSVRISESWYVLLSIISTVMFPVMVKAKAVSEVYYYEMISKVIAVNVMISLFFILIFNVFSRQIIILLFGTTYGEASTSLAILSWSGMVYAFGGVWGAWIIIENMQKWSMISIALAAIINILLNWLLIPLFGINGSAVATVFANIAALCMVGVMDRRLMKMNKMFLSSLSPVNFLRLARSL